MPRSQVEILRAACCVAGLDGSICEREQRIINRLAEDAGVGARSLQAMMERALNDKKFFQEQLEYVRLCPDETIKTLLAIAATDGELTADERIVTQHLAEKIGLPQDRFDRLMTAAEQLAARNKQARTEAKAKTAAKAQPAKKG